MELTRAVMAALVGVDSFREAWRPILRAVGETMRWDVAALWAHDPDGYLHRHHVWNSARGEPDELVAGTAQALAAQLASRSPSCVLWLDDLGAEREFRRARVMAGAGFASGCWIPLGDASRMRGLVELLGRERRPADAELLQTTELLRALMTPILDRLAADGLPGQREGRFRLLVDGIADHALFLLDREGRIATWNSAGETMTGYTADELLGEHISCLYLDEDVRARKPFAELRAAALRGRFESDGVRVRKDGSRFWASAVVTALRDGAGTLLGFAVVERDDTERRLHEEELTASQEQLRALAARLDAVAEREKAHLAREIHDVLGQELTGLKMDIAWIARRLAAAEPQMATAELPERLAAMSAQIDTCVQNIRRIASGLRPSVLDNLGLAAAIEWQAREFESRSGLAVELFLPEGDLMVERERAAAVFRILQELLTNVARHAAAHHVRVRLGESERCLILEVSDNGRGMSEVECSRAGSLGLLGIRERAALFGGSLELRGGPGRGTTAVVRVPVRP